MDPGALSNLITSALALLFAAFGYRIVREIQLGDEGRKTWLLVTDWFVVAAMISLVGVCVVAPLAGPVPQDWVHKTVAAAYVVIAAHPLNTAAHYRLFSSTGREKYRRAGRDVPYVADHEALTVGTTVAALALTLWFVH